MLETRRRLQGISGRLTEKAGGRGWRQLWYDHCRISWEGKKMRKDTLLAWASPSEVDQQGRHPVTVYMTIKVQMFK